LTPKQIDNKKWEAAVSLVRAGGYLRRLLKERDYADPELAEATKEYQKALRKFKRMQVL